ncbi:MAG: hypothetical protein WC489_04720 [Patescibacteria group bacterium]
MPTAIETRPVIPTSHIENGTRAPGLEQKYRKISVGHELKRDFELSFDEQALDLIDPETGVFKDETTIGLVFEELVVNCLEKPDDHITVKAGVIYDLETHEYHVVVEDDVHYDSTRIAEILQNLNSDKINRDLQDKCEGLAMGGIGIAAGVKIALARWGGGLEYIATPDNRIVAVAHWNKDVYDNPHEVDMPFVDEALLAMSPPEERLPHMEEALKRRIAEGQDCTVEVYSREKTESIVNNPLVAELTEELATPSLEKRSSEQIQVTVRYIYDDENDEYIITVEDNVAYGDEELDALLADLRNTTTKGSLERAREILGLWAGTLSFERGRGGVVCAVARWKREAFEATTSA